MEVVRNGCFKIFERKASGISCWIGCEVSEELGDDFRVFDVSS